jgi:hypothetical protein
VVEEPIFCTKKYNTTLFHGQGRNVSILFYLTPFEKLLYHPYGCVFRIDIFKFLIICLSRQKDSCVPYCGICAAENKKSLGICFIEKGNIPFSKQAKLTPHPFQTGGSTMNATINWLTEFEHALDQSRTENKPILLDFFNPK